MEGTWSSGMILASGARGREFDSPSAPYPSLCFSSFVLLFVAEFIGNAVWELEFCGGELWERQFSLTLGGTSTTRIHGPYGNAKLSNF